VPGDVSEDVDDEFGRELCAGSSNDGRSVPHRSRRSYDVRPIAAFSEVHAFVVRGMKADHALLDRGPCQRGSDSLAGSPGGMMARASTRERNYD
jgi:hypothetical protein